MLLLEKAHKSMMRSSIFPDLITILVLPVKQATLECVWALSLYRSWVPARLTTCWAQGITSWKRGASSV